MSVYTKKGDGGKSSILDGKRLSKSASIFAALGALDEVNSWLGVVGGYRQIQKDLMIISSILAGAKLDFSESKTKALEKEIDRLEAKWPKVKGFVIPSGRGARLHFARALVRRAERAVVAVSGQLPATCYVLPYLNRLSDFFFIKACRASSN